MKCCIFIRLHLLGGGGGGVITDLDGNLCSLPFQGRNLDLWSDKISEPENSNYVKWLKFLLLHFFHLHCRENVIST